MDFWCQASALFALSWARACNSDSDAISIKQHMAKHENVKHGSGGALRQQLCARPGAHSGFTEHTERHRGEQHLR